MPEFIPFSHQNEGVAIQDGFIWIGTEFHFLQNDLCRVHRDWIIRPDLGALALQFLNNHDGRRLADIVRVGLEGKSQDSDGSAIQITDHFADLADHLHLLAIIGFNDRMNHAQVLSFFFCHRHQRSGVLWKT